MPANLISLLEKSGFISISEDGIFSHSTLLSRFSRNSCFSPFFKDKIVCVLYTKWAEIWQKSAVDWGEIGKSKQKQNGANFQNKNKIRIYILQVKFLALKSKYFLGGLEFLEAIC